MNYCKNAFALMRNAAMLAGMMVLVLGSLGLSSPAAAHPQHKFPTPELDAFHEALHPLIHEALPKNDIARIRQAATELDRLRKKVVKAKLPALKSKAHEKNVKELVGFFDAAMEEFVKATRKTGNDEEVAKALDAAHKEFEDLVEAMSAGMK